MQNLVKWVPLDTKFGREGTFTEKGIHKSWLPLHKIWWRGYLYCGRYLQDLAERVPFLKKVNTKIDGENTFTEESTYNT